MSMTPARGFVVALAAAVVIVQPLGAQTLKSDATRAVKSPSTMSDPKEIIRRSLALDQHDDRLAQNYTYNEQIVKTIFGKQGRIARQTSETGNVTILYGEPFFRLTRKNGKPLDASAERKVEQKLSRLVAQREAETPAERASRLAKLKKSRERSRAFVLEIADAYRFRLLGADRVNGRNCYVIEADPRPDFHSALPRAEILKDLSGKIWIDEKTFGWVKVEAHSLRTVSWGFLVLRIHKGAKLTFEQTRLNHEIWLPIEIELRGGARLALLMNRDFDLKVEFSNYQKFTSRVRVLPKASLARPRRSSERRGPAS